MKYSVIFTDKAKKQLKKLDKHTSLLIIAWIRKNLEDCNDPRLHGKTLAENKLDQWRYRVGNYRLLSSIEDKTITILILNIGHRKDIYK